MLSHLFNAHYLPFSRQFTEQGPAAYTDMLSHPVINYELNLELLYACLEESRKKCFVVTSGFKSSFSVLLTSVNSSPTHEEKVNLALQSTVFSEEM